MPFFGYKNVHVVLAEPDPLMSRNVSAALFARGMRDIAVCKNARELQEAVNMKPVDIMMCDVALPGMDFRETTQNIRNNSLGRNPYVQILATIGPTASVGLEEVTSAGVDDVLRKPIAANQVLNRFDALAKAKRRFVVTGAYVGPNRRKTTRPSDAEYMVNVPNTLRSKINDGLKPSQLTTLIDETLLRVQNKKAHSRPRAITALTTQILGYYEGRGTEEELRRDFAHLIEKCEELVKSHKVSDAAHIAEVAASMAKLAEKIARAPMTPSKIDLELLTNLSAAMRRSLLSTDESIAAAREIAKTVRNFLVSSQSPT